MIIDTVLAIFASRFLYKLHLSHFYEIFQINPVIAQRYNLRTTLQEYLINVKSIRNQKTN